MSKLVDAKKPNELPAFSEMDGAKRLVARFKDGRLSDLIADDPIYPPIMAVQDYRNRLETASVADRLVGSSISRQAATRIRAAKFVS
jgi:hypothetical protein